MIVTVEWLKSREACSDQVEVFTATFGESVEVTRESLTRANGAGLDLDWFGREMWGEVFDRVKSPADAAFDGAILGPWVTHNKVATPAVLAYWEACDVAEGIYRAYNFPDGWCPSEAKDSAWNVYESACAVAEKVYEEATSASLAAYKAVCAPALKAYQEALIEVIFNLSQVTSTS